VKKKMLIPTYGTVEFVSDSASYVIIRDIIVLDVHAATEDKGDDTKDEFYEELEHVFDQVSAYHMDILVGCCLCKDKDRRDFIYRQWGSRFFMELVMKVGLE
jgi:hypothetical protein